MAVLPMVPKNGRDYGNYCIVGGNVGTTRGIHSLEERSTKGLC